MEKTLVLLKPDAVQRGLCGEIIARLERTGLKIVGMKLMQVSEELANRHYGEHVGKPFFDGLVGFITSGPIVAMAFEGNNAASIVRKTMGATNPADSPPGSIRGDFGVDIGRNLVHGRTRRSRRSGNSAFSSERTNCSATAGRRIPGLRNNPYAARLRPDVFQAVVVALSGPIRWMMTPP